MDSKYVQKQLKQHPDLIDYQDVIEVVLEPGQMYSVKEAKQRIDEFLNKEVD